MHNMIQAHSPKKHIKSFKYAFAGVLHALLNEANFRIHIIATVVVVSLGFFFEISNIEWAIVVLITAMVLTAEMVNTVIEVLMDHMFKEYHAVAKITKDLGAGFVLISATAALVIFTLIFGERLKGLYYVVDPVHLNIDSEKLYEIRHENQAVRPKETIVIDVNKGETTPTLEERFYGSSTRETCSTSTDCIVSGCNAEICGSASGEQMASICVFPEEPLPRDLGYECGCVEQKCQWTQ